MVYEYPNGLNFTFLKSQMYLSVFQTASGDPHTHVRHRSPKIYWFVMAAGQGYGYMYTRAIKQLSGIINLCPDILYYISLRRTKID